MPAVQFASVVLSQYSPVGGGEEKSVKGSQNLDEFKSVQCEQDHASGSSRPSLPNEASDESENVRSPPLLPDFASSAGILTVSRAKASLKRNCALNMVDASMAM